MNATPRIFRRKQVPTAFAALALAAWLCAPQAAMADVYGRLQIKVRLQTSRQASAAPMAISGVRLTLRDTSGVNGDITLKTGRDFSVLSPPLVNSGWQLVRVEGIVAPPPSRSAAGSAPLAVQFVIPKAVFLDVTPDAISNVSVVLSADERRVARVNDLSFATQTGNVYPRDRHFIQRIPATGTNPQSLSRMLSTVP